MASADQPSVPVPAGWTRGVSRTLNRPYYYHRATCHTQWHFPTPAEAGDPSGTKRRMETERQQRIEKRRRELNSVAIIVPYRDLHPSQNRAKHLQQFVPHMKQFLSGLADAHKIGDYHIYIIEQSDDNRKFNRGKLLNIGFDFALKRSEKHPPRHNVFVFHDVDLLPQPDLGEWYARYPKQPTHIARVWVLIDPGNSASRDRSRSCTLARSHTQSSEARQHPADLHLSTTMMLIIHHHLS